MPKPVAASQYWSMDFVHDQLATGRKFRVPTVIAQRSRESVLLETQFALTGQNVVDALEALSRSRPLPKVITVDHDTEFTSKILDAWAYQRGAQLDFIRSGEPTENAFIESFGGRPRDECQNVLDFVSLDDAQARIEHWQLDYCHRRPHGALGNLTPSEFAGRGRIATSELVRLQI